jgi:hypothetical protein
VIHPTLEPEFAGRTHFVEYVEEALAGTGVPVLNLFPLYQATGRDIRSFRIEERDFTHPDAEAHRLIAGWIEDDWIHRGLIPAAPEPGAAGASEGLAR